jgi:hypothetical protein
MVLAENGAELAAKGIADSVYTADDDADWQGKIYGRMSRNDQDGKFKIYATGETAGVKPVKAEVEVDGNAKNGKIRIDFTKHKP